MYFKNNGHDFAYISDKWKKKKSFLKKNSFEKFLIF